MSKKQPSQADIDIAQIDNTRRILGNLKGILRTGNYAGADVHQVAEAINFTNHLFEECNKQIAAMKAAAKSEVATPEMMPIADLPQPEGV